MFSTVACSPMRETASTVVVSGPRSHKICPLCGRAYAYHGRQLGWRELKRSEMHSIQISVTQGSLVVDRAPEIDFRGVVSLRAA